MFTLKGKYTSAQLMTINEVEQEAINQIYNLLNHPASNNTQVVIMPDVHSGNGCVIGLTQTSNQYVIPSLIGVDIGCGIETYNLGQQDIDFENLDKFIRTNIPAGFHIRTQPLDLPQQLDEQIRVIAEKIEKCDVSRSLCSIGTLGGGNHFIELNKDDSNNIWLTIHTGSRKFGLDIANFYQQKAKLLMNKMFIGDAYKQLEFLPFDQGGQDYLTDMTIAQKYAERNRYEIAKIIIEKYFGLDLVTLENIKSIHNYFNFQDKILRKGAISAHQDERIIIPLNMRDGSIIARGKENSKWNFSAPHGAGRLYSRKRAKQELTIEQFQKEMTGIWTSCVKPNTLDESPMAYKDKQIILDVIDETAQIEFIMKTIYNFKGN